MLDRAQHQQCHQYAYQELFANRKLVALSHGLHDAKYKRQRIDAQHCGQTHSEVPIPRMRAIEAANVVQHIVLEELPGRHNQLTMPVGIYGNAGTGHQQTETINKLLIGSAITPLPAYLPNEHEALEDQLRHRQAALAQMMESQWQPDDSRCGPQKATDCRWPQVGGALAIPRKVAEGNCGQRGLQRVGQRA